MKMSSQLSFDGNTFQSKKKSRRKRRDKRVVKCDYCNKIFTKKVCEIERNKHNFCSSECYTKWSSENLRGERKNTWNGGKEVVCFSCGKKVWLTPAKLSRNKHYFCSVNCYRNWWRNNNRGEMASNWKGGKGKKESEGGVGKKGFCKFCNKEFFSYSSNNRQFCSRVCYVKWKSQRRENHPAWKGGEREKICRNCGKNFEVSYNVIKKGKGFYCSKDCYLQWKTKNKKGQAKVVKVCPVCGKEFITLLTRIKHGKGKYCSKKCARQRQKFPQHHTKPEKIFEEICKKNNLPFRYVGDSQLWIGKERKLNPDFCELNGKKIVIEIFGEYWHSQLYNPKIPIQATLSFRKEHYKRYGWKSIFIWDFDLLRKNAEQFILNFLKKEKILKNDHT